MIGLVWEVVFVVVYGVGLVMNVFNYVLIVLGFFLMMFGGINGFFYFVMIVVFSKCWKEDG